MEKRKKKLIEWLEKKMDREKEAKKEVMSYYLDDVRKEVAEEEISKIKQDLPRISKRLYEEMFEAVDKITLEAEQTQKKKRKVLEKIESQLEITITRDDENDEQ